jgi:hypothetical protein
MKNVLRFLFLASLVTAAFGVEVAGKDVPLVAKTETIRGAVSTVDLEHNLVILKSADGIFSDFQVQRTTTEQPSRQPHDSILLRMDFES